MEYLKIFSICFLFAWFGVSVYRLIKKREDESIYLLIGFLFAILVQFHNFIFGDTEVSKFLIHSSWILILSTLLGEYLFYRPKNTLSAKEARSLVSFTDKYYSLVENTPIGIYVIDSNGRIEFVNLYLARMLEYNSFGDLVGRNIFELVPQEKQEEVAENIRKRVEGKIKTVSYESQLITKSGRILPVLIVGSRTENGHVTITGSITPVSKSTL